MDKIINIALILIFLATLLVITQLPVSKTLKECENQNGVALRAVDYQYVCIKKDSLIDIDSK